MGSEEFAEYPSNRTSINLQLNRTKVTAVDYEGLCLDTAGACALILLSKAAMLTA